MLIKARLIEIMLIQTGESKNGAWKKQDVIVETLVQYPKKICISFWNDKIDSKLLKVGNDLMIDFDIESRCYNGRWYTEVKAWRVTYLLKEGIQISSDTLTCSPEIDILPF